MEAELPPESGADPELESELPLAIAFSDHLNGDAEMTVTYDDDATEVMDRGTGSLYGSIDQTLVTASPMRPRAITAEDGTVSGTISSSEDLPPARRARRHSESRDD